MGICRMSLSGFKLPEAPQPQFPIREPAPATADKVCGAADGWTATDGWAATVGWTAMEGRTAPVDCAPIEGQAAVIGGGGIIGRNGGVMVPSQPQFVFIQGGACICGLHGQPHR